MSEIAERTATKRGAVATWMRLARVYHKIDRRSAEAFRVAGLTTAQFDVLAQVGAGEGCTQQELADRLLVTKGNVCQLLDRMEAHGWIERRPARQGRGNLLYLTPAGNAIRHEVVPAQERRVTGLFESLEPDEQRELARLLRKLERSLD
jgi:DNA-binding MarR family transcriptional regulator